MDGTKKIVFAALPNDYSGAYTIVKASSQEEVEQFYANEPFFLNQIQTYQIKEIMVHYKDIENI